MVLQLVFLPGSLATRHPTLHEDAMQGLAVPSDPPGAEPIAPAIPKMAVGCPRLSGAFVGYVGFKGMQRRQAPFRPRAPQWGSTLFLEGLPNPCRYVSRKEDDASL